MGVYACVLPNSTFRQQCDWHSSSFLLPSIVAGAILEMITLVGAVGATSGFYSRTQAKATRRQNDPREAWMSDVDTMIRRDIADDSSIQIKALTVELRHKGLFPRRHFVHVGGTVQTEREQSRIGQIAHHHAGDAYRVVNEVKLKENADA